MLLYLEKENFILKGKQILLRDGKKYYSLKNLSNKKKKKDYLSYRC